MSTTPQRLGKYDLQQRLGHGGMAEVWKAFDGQLQRTVALKILHADLQNDPEFISRFQREARIIASLHHPNIVQLHDFQVTRDAQSNVTTAYMVMDYIEGQTLAHYLEHTSHQRQFPPAAHIVQLFTSIGLAVDYAHQHGLIHRDIKPANILLDPRNTARSPLGEPILTDFGMVKLLGTSTGLLSSSWMGTPLYVSPEQAQGYPGNEPADIYALGVILYEICTGALPFQGQTPAVILHQHISTPPPSPTLLNPHISPALAAVILRCLAKDPPARFSSASALAAALATAFNQPVPQRLSGHLSAPLDAVGDPTRYQPSRPLPAAGATPAAAVSLAAATPPASPPPEAATPAPNTPVIPAPVGAQTPRTSGQQALPPAPPPVSTPLAPSPTPPASRKRRRGMLIAALVLLALLLGSSLAALAWLAHQAGAPTPAATTQSQSVGTAFFVSSGQLNEGNSQGINDEVQLNLQNLPAPAAGSSYYAWLLGDLNRPTTPALPLGRLALTHGAVHLLYPGDQQHTNLIATYSRLLITEENATSVPTLPTSDHHLWRYYAVLPQVPDPNDTTHHYSMLDNLRHLLAEDPVIESLGVRGGLDIWLARNTGKILEWASSARDYWGDHQATTLMRNQFIRILDYIDGVSNVQADVPAGTPVLVGAPVALLGPNTAVAGSEVSPDYIHAINVDLNAITLAPGITPKMHLLVAQTNLALSRVRNWLENTHQDAKKLFDMTDSQLLSQEALSMLDDMVTQAFYAYVGQIDLSTNQVQAGVTQINYSIIQLGTFEVNPYKN